MSNSVSYAAWFLGGMVTGGVVMVLSMIAVAEFKHRRWVRNVKPLPRQD